MAPQQPAPQYYPAQPHRIVPVKVALPNRGVNIRPGVPRAPTWDRRPFRHEVSSMRTPAGAKDFEIPQHKPPIYSFNKPNGYYNGTITTTTVKNGSESGPESYGNIDEPYRLAKLKVMTGNNRGPKTLPRSMMNVQQRAISSGAINSGHGSSGEDQGLSAYGEATDF